MKCSVDDCKKNVIDLSLSTCLVHSPECPVCLRKLGVGDETSVLRCGHKFHACCIYNWFDQRLNCPLCRLNIRSG